jgi:hypothetical protein
VADSNRLAQAAQRCMAQVGAGSSTFAVAADIPQLVEVADRTPRAVAV